MVAGMNPTARAGRVWQWNQDRTTSQRAGDLLPADQLLERSRREKTRQRQPPDRNDHLRADDFELTLQPPRAQTLLVHRRDTVAAAGRAGAGIASGDGRYIDASPRREFIDASLGQPTKERLARAPGEGHASVRFDFSRRLADDHDSRRDRERLDRHDVMMKLAPPAAAKLGAMRGQLGVAIHRRLTPAATYRSLASLVTFC